MRHDPQSYRLPVGYHDLPFIAPRARTRWRLTGKRGNQVVTGNQKAGRRQEQSPRRTRHVGARSTIAPEVEEQDNQEVLI